MKDVIVYCSDTSVFIDALREYYPERLSEEDVENPVFIANKTPIIRRGSETLSLVRCRGGDRGEPDTLAVLEGLETLGVIQILGTWEEVKDDPDKREIYDRMYPRTPVTYEDDEGVEYTQTPPEEIGRFA